MNGWQSIITVFFTVVAGVGYIERRITKIETKLDILMKWCPSCRQSSDSDTP